MKSIVNIDYTNSSCNGSFNSACGCNDLYVSIRPLETQLTNYRVEVTDVNNVVHVSDIIAPSGGLDCNMIEYQVNEAWFKGEGNIRVRLLSDEGNSNYTYITCIDFESTDDVCCKYRNGTFVIMKCIVNPDQLPIATRNSLGTVIVGDNLNITAAGVLSATGGSGSTDTQKPFYFTNNHMAIDDESSVEGYDEITIYKKNDTPVPTVYTYTFSEAAFVSPSSLYDFWVYLDDLSTLRTYTMMIALKINGVLVSDSTLTFRPTTKLELVNVPMNVNYLESKMNVAAGGVATLDISIKNDLLVQYTANICYGGATPTAVIRNGGTISAQNVYDLFENETQTQSQINSTFKNRIPEADEAITNTELENLLT